MRINQLPIVFLSYDEPNAEENYRQLKDKRPDVLRVHKVKGLDAAHKMASEIARKHNPDSPCFVTVDADNKVHQPFWNSDLTLDALSALTNMDITEGVASFRAVNAINYTCYGNGGLKVWSHKFAERMVTHEAVGEGQPVVDFCWDAKYKQLPNIFSTTHPNGSPLQAFRAGYREGVKLSVAERLDVEANDLVQGTPRHVMPVRTLNQWAVLGADVSFGGWCIVGVIVGMTDVLLGQSDQALTNLIDHDSLTSTLSETEYACKLPQSAPEEYPFIYSAFRNSFHDQYVEPLLASGRLAMAPLFAPRSMVIRSFLATAYSEVLCI